MPLLMTKSRKMKSQTTRREMQAPDGSRLVSVAEAAREFNVPYGTIRELVFVGRIQPWFEIGTIVLVKADDVRDLTGVTRQSR